MGLNFWSHEVEADSLYLANSFVLVKNILLYVVVWLRNRSDCTP